MMATPQQQVAQNLLKKAREMNNGELPSVGQAADAVKDAVKETVKSHIKIYILGIIAAILPWILLIAIIIFIWFASCTNMLGTLKGWVLSEIMQSAGICAGLDSNFGGSAPDSDLFCSKAILDSGGSCQIEISGYSSEVGQTDDTPFLAADGTVYWGMLAANFLDFDTEVTFPNAFPGKIFEVHDRMNQRYGNKSGGFAMDIWFDETKKAWDWGRQVLTCSKAVSGIIACY